MGSGAYVLKNAVQKVDDRISEDIYISEDGSFVVARLRVEKKITKELAQEMCRKLACRYLLLLFDDFDEARLFFVSSDYEIQALEFLSYVLQEFGLVKGDSSFASGQIASMILKIKMVEAESTDGIDFFVNQVVKYFEECDRIDAASYGIENQEMILRLPRYQKRKKGWAFVKSVDVARKGEKIKIKTLENEAGMVLTVAEDAYIMIGCFGEVYDIERAKFEKSYQETQEPLDVFDKMLDYIPAVERMESGEYICLDEIAHICYPKADCGIYVRVLEKRTKIFPIGNDNQYYYGRPGDYMAIRVDDLKDCYIIKKGVFEQTYELAEDEKENLHE